MLGEEGISSLVAGAAAATTTAGSLTRSVLILRVLGGTVENRKTYALSSYISVWGR